MTESASRAPAFDLWLDSFFDAYYRQRPVNATFIGKHEYDYLLPDLSLDGADQARHEIHALRSRLYELPGEPLSAAQRLDRQLATGFLEIADWEYGSGHFLLQNPSVYTGEAIFGVISLFLRPFAPFAQRAHSAIARLEAIPAFLAQGKEVVREAPPEWTDRALRECGGALAFLRQGIDRLASLDAQAGPALQKAASGAAAAFTDFQRWLETELRAHPSNSHACGLEALDLLVRRGHFLRVPLDEIELQAQHVLEENTAYLRAHARDFGAHTPSEALAQLTVQHPSVHEYYGRYQEIWNQSRALADRHRLLTWPDYPITFRPQPDWVRGAAPSLYFLYYRSPAPYEYPLPVEYLVTPIEPDMPVAEQEHLLRATNDSVIKLNHVVHHGGIGHHLQNWHAFRAESRIGQIAAVDCASRIALFCGGTMAEGWACYATELMDEFGFLTPLEQFAECHTRIRMAARAMADIRLHDGRWSLEQVAGMYQEHVGMSVEAARSEAVKNSMFPGTALMYLTGTEVIHRLRRAVHQQEGPDFDLARFHNRFLSYGSVPVELIAEAMREESTDAQ